MAVGIGYAWKIGSQKEPVSENAPHAVLAEITGRLIVVEAFSGFQLEKNEG